MTVIYCVSRKSRNVLSGRELFSLCSAVVEVGVGEMLPGYADFHFVERVRNVGRVEFVDAQSIG